MNIDLGRRKWLKNTGTVVAFFPLVLCVRNSEANMNLVLRAEFKYQNTPKDKMSCLSCLEFIPGKTDKDLGGCKVLPGDDEISPAGYCIRWNTM